MHGESRFWGLHNDGGVKHPVLKTEMLGKEVARWSCERKARSERTLGARSLPPGVRERIPQTRKREGREGKSARRWWLEAYVEQNPDGDRNSLNRVQEGVNSRAQ